jgi:hypothetical protein
MDIESRIRCAISELQSIPKGVVTLGMHDRDEVVYENYLIVSRHRYGRGLCLDGFARRQVAWVIEWFNSQSDSAGSRVVTS